MPTRGQGPDEFDDAGLRYDVATMRGLRTAMLFVTLVGCNSRTNTETTAETRIRSSAVPPPVAQLAEPDAVEPTVPNEAAAQTPDHGELPNMALARLGTTTLRHVGIANAVASSADGARVASATSRSIRVWTSKDGSLIAQLEARRTEALAFSSDGEILVSASSDGSCQIWDLAGKRELARLDLLGELPDEDGKPKRGASALAITPDGSTVVAGHRGGTIAVWDLAKRERIGSLDSGHGSVESIAITSDGTMFASTDYAEDGAIVAIFERATLERVATLRPKLGLIVELAFTPDNRQIILGSQDAGIHAWKIATRTRSKKLSNTRQVITALAVSPDGQTVLAAAEDPVIRSFSLGRGGQARRYTGPADEITALAIAANASLVVAAGLDSTVRLWSLAKAEPLLPDDNHAGAVLDLAWSADMSMIATVARDHQVRLWNGQSYALERSLEAPPGHTHRVALNRDATVVAVNGEDEIRVYNGRTGELRMTLLPNEQRTFAVAVSPDGSTLASGGFDGLHMWTGEGVPIARKLMSRDRLASLVFAPDGGTLAVGWADGRVTIVAANGETGRTINTGYKLQTLAYDGERVAVRTGLNMGAIYDSATGKLVTSFDLTVPLGFRPGGTRLLAATRGGDRNYALHVIDVASGELVRSFPGHDGAITAAAFSADGRRFASASRDTTALVWTSQ